MSTWWSLDFGPVHFTVISTELSFNMSSEQYEFVKNDWAAVDRTKTPFLLLLGHRSVACFISAETAYCLAFTHSSC